MTDTVVTPDAHDADHGEGHDHPSDLLYIKVAIGLAILTAGEVALHFTIDDGPLLVFPLLVATVIKFAIIASFFMHLRFDSKILNRIFYAGLALAVAVYVATLMTFEVFSQGGGG